MTRPALDRAVVGGRLAQVAQLERAMLRKLAKLAKLASALKTLGNSARSLARN